MQQMATGDHGIHSVHVIQVVRSREKDYVIIHGHQMVGHNAWEVMAGCKNKQSNALPNIVVSFLMHQIDRIVSMSFIIMIFMLSYILIMLISTIVCVKDTYPKGLKWNCKKTYPCAKLARRNMCRKKYNQIMNRGSKNQISSWLQQQPVRNFCKKSCKNCVREYFTVPSI